MLKTKVPDDIVVAPAKNHLPDVKKCAWAYLVTALLYLVAGGPPMFGFLFLMTTFFAGVLIFQNSAKGEQVASACTMVAFLLINAAYIAFPPHGYPVPSENLAVGLWIINKLLYVFGLALFVPKLLDPWVKKNGRCQTWAIALAFSAQFILAAFMFHEKQEENHTPVQCEKVVELTCVPVETATPWYTRATLAEDMVFGLQVVLLMAAFNIKNEDPVQRDEKQS